MDKNHKFESVEEYFSTLPKQTKKLMRRLQSTIKQAAPKAKELISYNMPAFKLTKILVYYAAYKEHIGFYPGATTIEAIKKDLLKFKTSKGTVQFQLNDKIPARLVIKIVKFRIKQDNVNKGTT